MIKDIDKIKEYLEGYVEVDIPYPFKKGHNIRYITMKEDGESFYIGGNFVSLGNNCIILQNNFRKWSVPTFIFNKKGDISYRSRFFIISDENQDDEDNKKFKEIINYQQNIIDKLENKISELERENMLMKKYFNK